MSSIGDTEKDLILDLLSSDKSFKQILDELKITRAKLNYKIKQIALKLYNEDYVMEDIIEATRLTETKLKRILDEQTLKLNYEKQQTITGMLSTIDKKQTEIIQLQQRIVTMLNDSWRT